MSTATDSPRKDSSNIIDFKHAAPIPILSSPCRRRSSISSADGSSNSPQSFQTPNSSYPTTLAPSSPTSSSFLSYSMSTSPKTSTSFPYRRPPGFGAPPVFEGRYQSLPSVIDHPADSLPRSSLHRRRGPRDRSSQYLCSPTSCDYRLGRYWPNNISKGYPSSTCDRSAACAWSRCSPSPLPRRRPQFGALFDSNRDTSLRYQRSSS